MSKSGLQRNAQAICLLALTLGVVGGGFAVWNGVRMGWPQLTLPAEVAARYADNEAFAAQLRDKPARAGSTYPLEDEQQIDEMRRKQWLAARTAEWHRGMRGLVQSLIFIAVCSVVFAIHAAIVLRSGRAEGAAGTGARREPMS
jgi:hypothetical protein